MCGLVCRVLHVNIRMSLMVGSIPTPPTWHGVWLRLIEDTATARGASASALATRTYYPYTRLQYLEAFNAPQY